jgi:hypothetical protein
MEIPSQIELLLRRFVEDEVERDRIRRAILRADAAECLAAIDAEYRTEITEIQAAASRREGSRAKRGSTVTSERRRRRRRRAA